MRATKEFILMSGMAAAAVMLLAACGENGGPEPANGGGDAASRGEPAGEDAAGSEGEDASEDEGSSGSADAAGGEAGPGLGVGDRAPDVTLYTQSGEAVRLASLIEQGPVVLTFYRGGWCPFCQKALQGWQAKLGELHDAGGMFVAVSPESPQHMSETVEKFDLGGGATVLGDPNHEAARAFKVAFTVDEETQEKYKGLGLNVGEWNADGSWNLPAPGTFVIDREGVVRWVFADWDYRKRAEPDEVIAFVRDMQ